MRYVMITGGAGFIGSHLSERFKKEGYNLLIVDNLFRGRKENIRHLLDDKNSLFEIDLVEESSTSAIKDILVKHRPTYILHYAAINGTQYFYDIPQKVAEVNSIGTYRLLNAISQASTQADGYKPLVAFASTSETYGEPFKVPTTEDDVTYMRIDENRDSYAVAKLMSEFYVKLYCQSLGIDWLIFRIFNVYGPRMVGTKYGQVIPEFIKRLKEGEVPLNVLGDGKHTRSFIYVEDHVELVYRAVIRAKRNEVYNVGNPVETSIGDLAVLIMRKMGIKPAINFLEERRGDHKRRVPDVRKLLGEIGSGFRFVSLEEGIEKLLAD